MRNLRQIKDLINNAAKKKGINSQILLRNYMMERLLERIALSNYKDNFILKGGMLVSALVGVESRLTIDMDTTIKRKAVSMESVRQVLEDIMSMDIDDGVRFKLKSIDEIRDDAQYYGFRAAVEAKLDTAKIHLKIDITTGDEISPKEELRQYNLLLEERSIEIYSYNIETILAEKLETIVARSITNTRMRDFYDIYILLEIRYDDIEASIFGEALRATTKRRETFHLLENGKATIDEVLADDIMKTHWRRYQNKYGYAKEVTWDMIGVSVYKLWSMVDETNQ